ncbi:fatty acyl-CoA hydrolase precursor, medium chain-like isoform X2 [Hypanus sabinus]|uniref:fatty acyl-CoA hydrolase precursor, medium chain-like isoform X2 n=1 Tax=Hypanus sabinus TaxID=79690 RepID=UPI0028C3D824|nr:fatty acyl-CoA hydrolase precursor, medium chain-like isoform X2 [Hypanus sabinus]
MLSGWSVALLGVLVVASAADADDGPPIVVTKYGALEGKQVSVKGMAKPVYNYLGIPFAKPPVGPLRFSVPQTPETWTGTRKATTFAPGCLQNSTLMELMSEFLSINSGPAMYSEDCLYLNVHTPVRPSDNKTKLSVMVWIHGGGFVAGNALLYDGSSLAAYEDVVVVVIQYRLGVLGFLSSADEHMPANLGMMDQIEALKWVQENIKSFGGDPNSVTIFGESAGGISVSLLLASPLATGLFHKAISESGTALYNVLFNPDPNATVQWIAGKVGCGLSTSLEVVTCLRNKSGVEIINLTGTKMFAPIVTDGIFLTKNAEQLFEAKEITVVPYLLGITNHECGWLISRMMSPPGWKDGLDRETSRMIIRATQLLTDEEVQRVQEEYMGDTQDRIEIRDLHLELLGDVFMLEPTIRAARYFRDARCPVYLYEFQHKTSILSKSRPDFVKADHGDEIGYVFGSAFWDGDILINGSVTAEEMELSRTIMKYWANFAKTGNPNGEGLALWPLYDQSEGYLQLNLKPTVGMKLKEHRMKILTKVWNPQAGSETTQTPENLAGAETEQSSTVV